MATERRHWLHYGKDWKQRVPPASIIGMQNYAALPEL